MSEACRKTFWLHLVNSWSDQPWRSPYIAVPGWLLEDIIEGAALGTESYKVVHASLGRDLLLIDAIVNALL